MPAIRAESLSKRYRKDHSGASLKTTASAWFSRRSEDEWLWALRDVDVVIEVGEAVGVIGPNGAGKSTLLRLLSRLTRPTTGTIAIQGRMASLLEINAGFHPDLSGRENVFLNGTILGLTRAEIRRCFDEIVAFAELERFIDTPVKHYSSGMSLRLGFAVAAYVHCDVFVADEVLAVGDAQFAEKSIERLRRLRDEGTTIVVASHALETISHYCSRALLIRQGRLEADGPAARIVSQYERSGSR